MSVRFNKVFQLFVLFMFLSTSVSFASTCYSRDEAEAEQGIRIHSELMVIGLNCQHMRFQDGTNLYLKYRDFTSKHSSLFSGYEDRLMSYFQRTGDRNPEKTLNTMRTKFANKISKDAADMKPHNFCNRFAARIFQADHMNRSDLQEWASTFHQSHPVSQPICEH